MEYFSLPKMDKLKRMTQRNALRECFVNIPKKPDEILRGLC